MTAKISNRERDRILAQLQGRLAGAEALVKALASVWWGRLALKLALRRIRGT